MWEPALRVIGEELKPEKYNRFEIRFIKGEVDPSLGYKDNIAMYIYDRGKEVWGSDHSYIKTKEDGLETAKRLIDSWLDPHSVPERKAIELGGLAAHYGINWNHSFGFTKEGADAFIKWLEENGYEHRGGNERMDSEAFPESNPAHRRESYSIRFR